MKCPHCQVAFSYKPSYMSIGADLEAQWAIGIATCSECGRFVISLVGAKGLEIVGQRIKKTHEVEDRIVRPRTHGRDPCPKEVSAADAALAEDYAEACLVLRDSPKASAALARRALQHVLREHAKVNKGDLASEIQEAIDRKLIPGYLAEELDIVRAIGNFAAHPIKSTSTGEVVPVEPGEAEATLDILEGLFEFFFVEKERSRQRVAAVNAKLAAAGKPPIRQPPSTT